MNVSCIRSDLGLPFRLEHSGLPLRRATGAACSMQALTQSMLLYRCSFLAMSITDAGKSGRDDACLLGDPPAQDAVEPLPP